MVQPDLSILPEPLRAATRVRWNELVAAGVSEQLQQSLHAADALRVFAASDYVADSLIRFSSLFDEGFISQLTTAASPADIPSRVHDAVADAQDETRLHAGLRAVRRREMVRIAWRDLAGWATLDETLADLSAVAGACIEHALVKLTDWHAPDTTERAPSLVVLGLGKLGAEELNFSSDVDLVFAYPEGDDGDYPGVIGNDGWYARLGQKLIRALDETTVDGFVFRVDMRLRPFGTSGSLAMSFAAMEKYYEGHGRDWERYALVKARPVAGDLQAGEDLLRALRPFIYRRYLDYNAFESLRDMKAMIAREVARRGLQSNIKLGRGGIREVEFIGQVFQLIRGGRDAALRARSIRSVLRTLAEGAYLSAWEAAALDKAYVFLRRSENRLQMVADRQTHELPEDARSRLRLAWSMGFVSWTDYADALAVHRDTVRAVFDQVFAAPEESLTPTDDAAGDKDSLCHSGASADATGARALVLLGFRDRSAAAIRDLYDAPAIQSLGARGRRRLEQLMPRVIRVSASSAKPDTTLASLLQLIEVVAGRTAYLALLAENEFVLQHLATIAAASPWLLKIVTRVPLLMDELIDPRIFQAAPDEANLTTELETVLRGVAPVDQESEMDALRQFQQAALLRIAAADLSGNADAMLVSRRLTVLATVVLREVVRLTRDRLIGRHGLPVVRPGEPACEPRLAVIAYGSLGSEELGYGSDLDLVFIHDGASATGFTNGSRPVDASVFMARWSQRIISFLSTPTSAGVLYRTDTRLRPSGSSGLLVTGFDGFARYQRESAWTWEHQALIRARAVAGDAELAARFNQLRHAVLCRKKDPAILARGVATMRERMRRTLAVETYAGFDVKQDRGGLIDIEFLTQYWVLLHAHECPDLVRRFSHATALSALATAGFIDASVAEQLSQIYHAYLGRIHRSKLEGWGAVVPEGDFRQMRATVESCWQQVLG